MLPRPLRALVISLAAFVIAASVASIAGVAPDIQKASIGTAYAALALLGASLALGPISLLRTNRFPMVNTMIRRDLGIAAALLAIAHTAIALKAHIANGIAPNFLPSPAPIDKLPVAFIVANNVGLVAVLLLTAILLISNDSSLRRLGATRWKRAQSSAYIAAILTVAHGLLYQILEQRRTVLVLLFGAWSLSVLALQLIGRSRRLKWNSHT
jgi:sulfoxide reductase heme-binding subunit YedZ